MLKLELKGHSNLIFCPTGRGRDGDGTGETHSNFFKRLYINIFPAESSFVYIIISFYI